MDRNSSTGVCPRKSIAVLGAARVGKTCLIKEVFNGEKSFTEEYTPTVEDSYFHLVRMPDGYYYQLQVIDTGGAHSFPAMRDLCISTSDCFMLVFSYDSRESWHECLSLYATIKRIKNENNPAVIFVANKSDLLECEREVNDKHVKHMCETKLLCKFMSTSAKTFWRVSALFDEVVTQTWQYTQRRHSAPDTVGGEIERRRFRSLGRDMLRRVSMAAAIPIRGGTQRLQRLASITSATSNTSTAASIDDAAPKTENPKSEQTKSVRQHSAVKFSTSMTIPDEPISPTGNLSFDAFDIVAAATAAQTQQQFDFDTVFSSLNSSVERRDSGNASLPPNGKKLSVSSTTTTNDSPLSLTSTAPTSSGSPPERQTKNYEEEQSFRRRVASTASFATVGTDQKPRRRRRESAQSEIQQPETNTHSSFSSILTKLRGKTYDTVDSPDYNGNKKPGRHENGRGRLNSAGSFSPGSATSSPLRKTLASTATLTSTSSNRRLTRQSFSVASDFARASAAVWSSSKNKSSKTAADFSPQSRRNKISSNAQQRRSSLAQQSNGKLGTVTNSEESGIGRRSASLAATEKRQMFARSKQTTLGTIKPAAVTANKTMIYFHDYDVDND